MRIWAMVVAWRRAALWGGRETELWNVWREKLLPLTIDPLPRWQKSPHFLTGVVHSQSDRIRTSLSLNPIRRWISGRKIAITSVQTEPSHHCANNATRPDPNEKPRRTRLKLNVRASLPGPAGKVREQSPVVRGLPAAHAVARQRRKQRTMSTCQLGAPGVQSFSRPAPG